MPLTPTAIPEPIRDKQKPSLIILINKVPLRFRFFKRLCRRKGHDYRIIDILTCYVSNEMIETLEGDDGEAIGSVEGEVG